MIYGRQNGSALQKSTLMVAQTIILAAGLWLLLFGGLEGLSSRLGVAWDRAETSRRVTLAAALCIVYLRMGVTMFVLLRPSPARRPSTPAARATPARPPPRTCSGSYPQCAPDAG